MPAQPGPRPDQLAQLSTTPGFALTAGAQAAPDPLAVPSYTSVPTDLQSAYDGGNTIVTTGVVDFDVSGTAGISLDASAAALTLKADGYQAVNGKVLLTDNTAITVLTISLLDGELTGGILNFSVFCSDQDLPPQRQVRTRSTTWSAVNKGGAYTTDVGSASDTGTDAISASSGTLAVTVTITTGTNLINIQITADTSLASPAAAGFFVRFWAEEFGSQTLTVG